MGGSPKTTTTVSNPWEDMPPWLEAAYKKDTAERDRLLRRKQQNGPRSVLGMNSIERGAYNNLLNQTKKTNQTGVEAQNILKGLGGTDFVGNYEDVLSDYDLDTGQLGGFDHGYDAVNYEAGYDGSRLSDMLEGKDFGLEYTEDVVDTTLAGMDRQAERERLQRQSRQAATGGVSNTRSAVEDAVAGQLTGMNMAEVEAQLRDNAQRYGDDRYMETAGLLDDSDRYISQQELDALGMTDASSRFLSGQQLAMQEAEEASKRFGMGFDLDLANLRNQQYADQAQFDMQRGMSMEDLATSAQKRNMASFDVRNAFGEKQRGIQQGQANKWRDHVDSLLAARTGSASAHQSAPNTTVQTNTQQGNSAFQNVLGIGSSLAGAFMMSDENVKHDITDQDGSALEKLKGLNVKEYQYDEGYGHTTDRTTGLMAQDIERAGITGAVKEIDGVKQVDPYPVLATVVAAVKELEAKVK